MTIEPATQEVHIPSEYLYKWDPEAQTTPQHWIKIEKSGKTLTKSEYNDHKDFNPLLSRPKFFVTYKNKSHTNNASTFTLHPCSVAIYVPFDQTLLGDLAKDIDEGSAIEFKITMHNFYQKRDKPFVETVCEDAILDMLSFGTTEEEVRLRFLYRKIEQKQNSNKGAATVSIDLKKTKGS